MKNSIRWIGKARHVFAWLQLQAYTHEMETDPDWWALRLWIVRN